MRVFGRVLELFLFHGKVYFMVRAAGKLRLAAFLMIMTIVLVAAFQAYWIRKLYAGEWSTLKKETDVAFRDIVYDLQMERFHSGKTVLTDAHYIRKGEFPDNLFMFNVLDSVKARLKDTAKKQEDGRRRQFAISLRADLLGDSIPPGIPSRSLPEPGSDVPFIIRYLAGKDSAAPLSIGQMDS